MLDEGYEYAENVTSSYLLSLFKLCKPTLYEKVNNDVHPAVYSPGGLCTSSGTRSSAAAADCPDRRHDTHDGGGSDRERNPSLSRGCDYRIRYVRFSS